MVFSPGVSNRIVTGVVPQPIPSTVTRAPAGSLVTMSEFAASTVVVVAAATTGSVGAGAAGDTGDCGVGVAAVVVWSVLAEPKLDPAYAGPGAVDAAVAGGATACWLCGRVHSCHVPRRIPATATVATVAAIRRRTSIESGVCNAAVSESGAPETSSAFSSSARATF